MADTAWILEKNTQQSRVRSRQHRDALFREITRRIVNAVHPEMILLFGSRAYGQPRAHSDIDLLIIRNARGSDWQRRQRIVRLFPHHVLEVDPHVYTPREAAHRLEMGDPFFLEIVGKGRVLYEGKNGQQVGQLIRKKLRQGQENPMDNGKVVEEWSAKAEGDFKAAHILARQRKNFLPDNLCWACEQCAEKYLKAFLIRHRVKFERTHDLDKLYALCRKADSDFRLIAEVIKPLMICEPPIRYPGKSVTADDARAAFEAMKQIRKFLRAKLGLK